MSDYKPKDLKVDTQNFLASQYGKHIIDTLKEMNEGNLSNARNINELHPDRYLARYGAIQEVIELINQPLDDSISPRG